MMVCLLLLSCYSLFYNPVLSLSKVIVPSVYKEWELGMPDWMTSAKIQQQYGFSTFLYQKLDPKAPNFIAKNRGTEAGVYLRYVVDHYENLPDIMVFVHASPHDHQRRWLEMIGCISPTATYMNFNFVDICRNSHGWFGFEIWVEQCWRDILRLTWNMTDKEEFDELVPPRQPVSVCFVCCQQFIVSREQIRKRSLETWKNLLRIVAEQDVCRIGDPDYEDLYAFTLNSTRVGPEQPDIVEAGESSRKKGFGQHTQGGAMEHLAHVIFGHHPLKMAKPNQQAICQNFLPQCPGSPCMR